MANVTSLSVQGGPTLPKEQKLVLNRIEACRWD